MMLAREASSGSDESTTSFIFIAPWEPPRMRMVGTPGSSPRYCRAPSVSSRISALRMGIPVRAIRLCTFAGDGYHCRKLRGEERRATGLGVRLVNDDRDTEQPSGKYRRHTAIAALTHHNARIQ